MRPIQPLVRLPDSYIDPNWLSADPSTYPRKISVRTTRATAVDADWPDSAAVGRYVRHRARPSGITLGNARLISTCAQRTSLRSPVHRYAVAASTLSARVLANSSPL